MRCSFWLCVEACQEEYVGIPIFTTSALHHGSGQRYLVTSLARLDFVASLELRTEVFTVKGRVHLTQRGFLEVYFNERTQTVAVAWIEAERRRWGIDRDNLRGWHRHPL